MASKGGKKLGKVLAGLSTKKTVSSVPINTIIPAGLASAGPPLGPLLGQRGLNIGAFCKDFNNKTSLFIEGVPLPCSIKVKPDRSYDLTISHPKPAYFLMQAAGIDRGAMTTRDITGKITIKHIYEIAKVKQQDYFNQLTPLKELCEKLVAIAHTIGIEVVRDLDAEEYKAFLEERKLVVEKQLEVLLEKKEAKMLRK